MIDYPLERQPRHQLSSAIQAPACNLAALPVDVPDRPKIPHQYVRASIQPRRLRNKGPYPSIRPRSGSNISRGGCSSSGSSAASKLLAGIVGKEQEDSTQYRHTWGIEGIARIPRVQKRPHPDLPGGKCRPRRSPILPGGIAKRHAPCLPLCHLNSNLVMAVMIFGKAINRRQLLTGASVVGGVKMS